MRRLRSCGGVLKSLLFLKFLPAGFTLFDGKAHPSSDIVPVGAETDVSLQLLQLHKSDICFAIPSVPISVGVQWRWWFTSLLGLWWLWRRCGGGVEEVWRKRSLEKLLACAALA